MKKYYRNKPAELTFAPLPNLLFNSPKIFMKKFKNIFYLILPLLFLLSSCEDDIISPSKTLTFDSARFDWTIDTLFGDLNFVSMWAADENNLYLADLPNSMLHYHNGVTNKYDFNEFQPWFISGISNNEVYIGGILFLNGGKKAHLKKWDGANFTDIFINNLQNEDVEIRKGAIRSSNDMCFGYKNYVIRYDGNSFYFYPMQDTTSFITKMFYNYNGNPSYIADYFDPSFADTNIYNYLFEFQDNAWHLVYSIHGGQTTFIHFYEIAGLVYGRNRKCYFNFTGNGFTTWMCLTNNIEADVNVEDGSSISNFMTLFTKGEWQECIYFVANWNGNSWSKEICLNRYGDTPKMFCVNSSCYFFKFENHYDGVTYILRAIRKK